MATVKFLLQSQKNPAAIYCRLASGNLSAKRKTGLYIDPAQWSKAKGLPIQKDDAAKAIHVQLEKLRGRLIDAFNEDSDSLNGEWLQLKIDGFFGRVDLRDTSNFIAEYAQSFVERLPYKRNKKGKQGVAIATLRKYQTVVGKLAAFDKYKGKRHTFAEMTTGLSEEMSKYFQEVERLSPNYSGRLLRFVATIAREARSEGKIVSPHIDKWKGYKDETAIVYLKPEEIEAIEAQRFTTDTMEAAKDWLVISCYTGQRVSDLLRMNSAMIESHEEGEFSFSLITLTQQKTGHTVSIPIHEKVQAILNKRGGEFPPAFGTSVESGSAIYNRLVKKVAKAAGLDEPTKGRLKDETGKKHTKEGIYPKWQLVSSHIGRRSFASNFYAKEKYPTPLLMAITGHTTERLFLEYIGQEPKDKAKELARIWAREAAARTNKPEGIVKSIAR